MRFSDLKRDKGVAGLTILLSLITMLFVIGLLVMIFVLMGTGMRDATYLTTNVSLGNETVTNVNGTALETLTGNAFRDAVCSFNLVTNLTDGEIIASNNYTVTNCQFNISQAGTLGTFNATDWNITYSYTWSADTPATDVMNDTTSGIASVTDWFPIFIVIGAMVVLILLTVIIITAIRSSGLIQVGSTGGRGNVGSA